MSVGPAGSWHAGSWHPWLLAGRALCRAMMWAPAREGEIIHRITPIECPRAIIMFLFTDVNIVKPMPASP